MSQCPMTLDEARAEYAQVRAAVEPLRARAGELERLIATMSCPYLIDDVVFYFITQATHKSMQRTGTVMRVHYSATDDWSVDVKNSRTGRMHHITDHTKIEKA